MGTRQQIDKNAQKARGLTMLGIVWFFIGGLLTAAAYVSLAAIPKVFQAEAVSASDFTNDKDQAILQGVMQWDHYALHVPEQNQHTAALSFGRTMTVLVPFTGPDWQAGDDVPVYITSPAISGVVRETAEATLNDYLAELYEKPDNILVTLVGDNEQSVLRGQAGTIAGITQTTIFAWPDHVSATIYDTRGPDTPPMWGGILVLISSVIILIIGHIYRRRSRENAGEYL